MMGLVFLFSLNGLPVKLEHVIPSATVKEKFWDIFYNFLSSLQEHRDIKRSQNSFPHLIAKIKFLGDFFLSSCFSLKMKSESPFEELPWPSRERDWPFLLVLVTKREETYENSSWHFEGSFFNFFLFFHFFIYLFVLISLSFLCALTCLAFFFTVMEVLKRLFPQTVDATNAVQLWLACKCDYTVFINAELVQRTFLISVTTKAEHLKCNLNPDLFSFLSPLLLVEFIKKQTG